MTSPTDTDDATSPPCEIVLSLARAADAGNPFAFTLEAQTYVRSLEGGAARSARFPWSAEVLEHLAGLQRERADPAAAAWLGEELGAFLRELAWEHDERRIREALDAGQPVHISLRFGAAELFALPWELVPLGASGRPLGSLAQCLLRYEWPETQTARRVPDPPPEGGRILVAWSAAGGVVPAEQHLEGIRRACREGRHAFDDRDVVAHASLGRLRQALRAAPVAVLHLLCHGGELTAGGSGYGLILDADEGGGKEPVDARALQMALADHAGALRLVVLSACHSGATGALDSRLGSVAQALHRAGIPAVVASRYPLATNASCELTEALYRGLLVEGCSLEGSFLAARAQLCERPGRAAWASLQLYARGADGADHRPIVYRPYRGLLPFQEEHARYYFGRDEEVREALGDLGALVEAGDAARPRFLIVTGASGTGKSSLVLAGVVPALRARDARWTAAVIRPTHGWKTSLAEALSTRADSDAPLLLVVDQFEELFTVIDDKADREALVGELWRLAGDPVSGVSVIATLRVDFLARCGEIRLGGGERTLEDVAYDEAHRVFIRRMKAEPLRAIIERPALRVGLELEEGLVEQMLAEAGEEPGALPLVQYTLDQLWQRREGRLLTWERYKELGGVGGALEKRADAILGAMDPVRQKVARRLLAQLVMLDNDARLDRRRRVPLDKLRRGPAAEATAFEEVLGLLVGERLLVSSRRGEGPVVSSQDTSPGSRASAMGDASPVIEVAHEQLIRSWGMLRTWVREDRRMLAELGQLERWVEEARGFPRYVLDSDRLGHAREIAKRYPDDVGEAARGLIARSKAAAARSRMWTRGVAIGGVAAAIAMGGLAVVAVRNGAEKQVALNKEQEIREIANRRAEAARDAALMAGARELLALGNSEPAMTMLMNVSRPQGMRGWGRLAYECFDAPRFTLRGHGIELCSARYGDDGRRVITTSCDGTKRLWRIDGSSAPVPLDRVIKNSLAVGFSKDLKRYVTASDDRYVRVWDADDPRVPVAATSTGGHVVSVAISADGKRFAATSDDSTAYVWSVDGSGAPFTLRSPGGKVLAVAFSPDGERVLATSDDNTAHVWSLTHSGEPIVRRALAAQPVPVVFSHDGELVISVCELDAACVWRADGSGSTVVLPHTKARILATGFSPDDGHVLTVSDQGASLWRTDGSRVATGLDEQPARVSLAMFSPDSKHFLILLDQEACLWNTSDPSKPAISFGFEGAEEQTHETINLAAFSPDSKRIVSGAWDRSVCIRDVERPDTAHILKGHQGRLTDVSFSPDGHRVMTASYDKTARIWSATDNLSKVIDLGQETREILAVSPDVQHFLIRLKDGTIGLWNTSSSSRSVKLEHEGGVMAAAFSPDSKRVFIVSEGAAHAWNTDGSGASARIPWSFGHDPSTPTVSPNREPRPATAAFSPDGKRVVITHAYSAPRVLNVDGSGEPIELTGHTDWVTSAAFSPDGKHIVTASHDDTACIWDAESGRRLTGLKHHDDVFSAVFSPDGRRIVTTTRLYSVHFWNADARDELFALRGHEDFVWSAVFNKEGTRLVTVSADQTARVWSADGTSEPIVIRELGRIKSAFFTPDGEHVVTVSYFSTFRIWPVSTEAILQALRREADPCLSLEMRRTYLNEHPAEGEHDPDSCQPAPKK